MRKIKSFIIILLILSLIFINIASSLNTLYERYETVNNNSGTASNIKLAQEFTIGNTGSNTGHTLTTVRLNLIRTGTPTGSFYVNITSVNATGIPLTTLASVSTACNTLTTSPVLYYFNYSSPAYVNASTMYAIVLNAPTSTSSFYVLWRLNTAGSYSGGCAIYTGAGDNIWTKNTARDFYFDEYGIPNASPTIAVSFPANGSTAISLQPKCAIYGNDSDGDSLTITWQSNYTGSYVTYQVNTSFTQATICRWSFTGANIQYKNYYFRVYVNDGNSHNVTKWFTFKTTLIYMTVSYSGLNPVNNTNFNYNKNYTLIASTLLSTRTYLFNLSFTKTCLQGFNTTTKIYANKSLLTTYQFINGSKTIDMLAMSGKTFYDGYTYSWSLNTTFYNLSYNRTYYFTLHIIMNNMPSVSLTIIDHHVNTTHSNQTYYNALTGWKYYDNDSGILTPYHFLDNHINTTYSHIVKQNGTGYWIYDNDTGILTPIHLIQFIRNATGTHILIQNGTGYWVNASYLGNTTTIPIHLINIILNATGTHTFILNLTGYWVTAHYTGNVSGNGTLPSNLTIDFDMGQFSISILAILTGILLFLGCIINDKRGFFILILAGFFSFSLFTSIILVFGGIWLFISPEIMIISIMIIYEGCKKLYGARKK